MPLQEDSTIGDGVGWFQKEAKCLVGLSRAAFLKLWSADHKWSSGSALVVLLD